MVLGRLWGSARQFTFDRPVIMASLIIGTIGPVIALFAQPLRRRLGIEQAPPLPISYPLPNRARSPPAGYDD